MSQPNNQLPLSIVKDQTHETTSKILKQRESKEIVIAFSGPVGSNIKQAVSTTKEALQLYGYTVHEIKISDIILEIGKKNNSDLDVAFDPSNKSDRYSKLQSAGNKLRENYGNSILANLAIVKITLHRKNEEITSTSECIPSKTAYLINQLKHPDEVDILKTVYRNLFYLAGVLANETSRKLNLKDKLSESDASKIMERDKNENIDHGQKLEKTLQLADFFLCDNHNNKSILTTKIDRFMKLIHGENGITPTNDEYGMHMAYSAGQKSACLSRQVGASITDIDSNIIATGCNDVPKANGGLYTTEHTPDHRCFNKGYCSNDLYKQKLCDQISEVLTTELQLNTEYANKIAKIIKNSSRLKDLIEFSRSVHAEMDAITSIARTGGRSVKGGTLYTTTFPCHNCARHIIASGIKKVVYIEPYEKSLAIQLHGEDISYEPIDGDNSNNKVTFIHFEGISPKQYLNFFGLQGARKNNDGKAIKNTIYPAIKIRQEYLDDYRDFEKKIVQTMDARNLIPTK